MNQLKFGNPIVVGALTADPSGAVNGEVYYNTTSNKFRVYVNGAWADLSTGSVSLTGQTLNSQNIIVGNGSNLSAAVDTNAVGHVLANSTNGLTIKSAVITNGMIAAAAAIDLTKLAALSNHNRALVSDGSGFITESAVTSTELGYSSGVTSSIQTQINGKVSKAGDTMSGDLDMGGNSITNLADPVSAGDAANKGYVDSAINGLAWKDPVRVVAISDITLSGEQTIDSVAVVTGESVLVAGQTDPTENGIYVVDSGSWTRRTDADSGAKILEAAVFVEEGTIYQDTAWVGTADSPITIGSTNLPFVQFNGAGSIIAGDALNKTGNTLNVKFDNTSIDINGSNQLEVKAGGIDNSKVSASAAIAYSKLNLTGSIVNADIASAAAIARNKLAALTANRVVVTDGSGFDTDNNSSSPSLIVNKLKFGPSSGNIVEDQYFHSIALSNNQSSAVEVDSGITFDFSVYSGFKMEYYVKDGSSPTKTRIGTVMVIANSDGSINSIVDSYTSTDAADVGVVFSAVTNGSNVELRYTTTNTSARVLRARILRFLV